MNADRSIRHPGIDMMRPEHAAGLQALAADPVVAEALEAAYPGSARDPQRFIEQCARERVEGLSFVHAVVAEKILVGLCGLHNVTPRESAELKLMIGRAFRGKGLGAFSAGNTLDFAFGPLQLKRVVCHAPPNDAALGSILAKHGFRCIQPQVGATERGVSGDIRLVYEVTRDDYFNKRNAPFLHDLCQDLKPILEAELAAGNIIGECSRGWPERDSVIIALKKPFCSIVSPLPANVEFREINDTHWWKAEYASKKPMHLLTCGF